MEQWAIWAAVSSEKQADDDKTSLPDQLDQGRAFVSGRGGAVVREFQVVHSRSDLLFERAKREMPEYANLEQVCEQKTITHLWCRGWDRIARCEAVSGAVSYLLRAAGVLVYSARAGVLTDPDTLAGALTASIERIQAQQEIRELTRRYRSGMKGRVLGRGLHPGCWPMGYTAIRGPDGKVTGAEFNDDIEVVRLITRLYIDDGLGYIAICRHLNDAGIPTAGRSKRWGVTTVRNILRNSVYAGFPHSGEVIAAEPSSAYPALWDADTWRRIQCRMQHNQRGGKPPGSQLSGVVVCAECGYKMALLDNAGYRYFRCNSKSRYGMTAHSGKHIREDTVAHFVENLVDRLVTDDDIETMIAGRENGGTEQELALLRGVIEDVKAQRVALGRKSLSGEIPGDVARELHLELSDRLEKAGARIAELEREQAVRPSAEEVRSALSGLCEVAAEPGWLYTVPIPTARALLARAGMVVYVRAGEIVGYRLAG